MMRLLLSLACVAWIAFVTIVVIVMEGYLSAGDTPPQSTMVRLLGGYGGQVITSNGDVSLLAWAWERILPVHLMAYLAWRVFKAVFLR